MAIQHNCDKCGAKIDPYFTYGNTVTIPMYIHVEKAGKQKLKASKSVDLCNGCMLELRESLGLDPVDRIEE